MALRDKEQSDPAKALAIPKNFDWCYKQGNSVATELHYVPIPASVNNLIESDWAKRITAKGGDSIWKQSDRSAHK